MVSLLLAVALGSSIGHADPLPSGSNSGGGDLVVAYGEGALPFGTEYVPGVVISDRLGVIVYPNTAAGGGEPGTCTFEIVTLNRELGGKILFDMLMSKSAPKTGAGGALRGIWGTPFVLEEQSISFQSELTRSPTPRYPYSTVMLGVVATGSVSFQIDLEGAEQPMFTVANADARRGVCKIDVIHPKQ
jgi:hypothetical protein